MYYFVTYQALSLNSGNIHTWCEAINEHPMDFIIEQRKAENESEDRYYSQFAIINSMEITKEQYKEYHGKF